MRLDRIGMEMRGCGIVGGSQCAEVSGIHGVCHEFAGPAGKFSGSQHIVSPHTS